MLDAARGLWPQTLFGLTLLGSIGLSSGPSALAWAGPMIAGLSLAIPFAVMSADPRIGRWASRVSLCTVPDEVSRPATLTRLTQTARRGERSLVEPPKAA